MNKPQYDEVQKIKTRLKEIMEGENNDRESSEWSNEEKNSQSEDFTQCISDAIDNLDAIDDYEEISEDVEEETTEEETTEEA